MSKSIGVYVIDSYGRGQRDCSWLFDRGFHYEKNIEGDYGLAILTGGADIHPSIYNEQHVGSRTYCDELRDKREIEEFQYITQHKPQVGIFGICRGAQLITAFLGGKLIQHVNGHASGHHPIVTYDNKKLVTNSIHHQMMYPYNLPRESHCYYQVLAHTPKIISTVFLNGRDNNWESISNENFAEPEIVYYHWGKNTYLAVQGHPEAFAMPNDTLEYIKDLTVDLLIKKMTPNERITSKVAEEL